MRTKVALLLIFVLFASGLILVKPASTQTIPAVPEFSLKLEDDAHNVVNSSGTFQEEVMFVDVVIKNTTSYSFYSVVNDSIVKLYYNVHVKGHSQDWADATISSNLAPQNNGTTVKFGLGSINPDPGGWSIWLGDITNETKIDFQVRAVEGFYTQIADASPHCWRNPNFSIFNETGRSAWSDTQTITIPNTSASESVTSTPTEILSVANFLLPVSVVVAAAVIVVLASALIYLIKHGKTK
jgi:hypothetical protein